mmetsp:Transcript_31469/g.59966  ORF Transcript_31469/g.59966 Transcript_31469/m.59966 type:complete len:80 (+) Transcript_31469:85-324(+)
MRSEITGFGDIDLATNNNTYYAFFMEVYIYCTNRYDHTSHFADQYWCVPKIASSFSRPQDYNVQTPSARSDNSALPTLP